jgi:hypothetical protein
MVWGADPEWAEEWGEVEGEVWDEELACNCIEVNNRENPMMR